MARSHRLRSRTLPLLIGAPGLLLAACGSTTSTQTSSASPHGVATFADQVGAAPNDIFPFTGSQYFSVDNLSPEPVNL